MSRPSARYLRRNATKQIAAYRESHTDIKAFTLDNNFTATTVTDADWLWGRWTNNSRATMKIEQNGTLTLTLHGNAWYVLSAPAQ